MQRICQMPGWESTNFSPAIPERAQEMSQTSVRELDAGSAARQTVDQRRQPALGLLSKAAGGDRPPFIALTCGLGKCLALSFPGNRVIDREGILLGLAPARRESVRQSEIPQKPEREPMPTITTSTVSCKEALPIEKSHVFTNGIF